MLPRKRNPVDFYASLVMLNARGNEAITEQLIQESDDVTSCVHWSTISHKPPHPKLIWVDFLSEIIMELLKHTPLEH